MNPDPESQVSSSGARPPSSDPPAAAEARGIHRAALLSLMQKVLLGLLLYGLVTNQVAGPPPPARTNWTYLLVGLALLTALSWRLGTGGHYRLAAMGTVLVPLSVPWSSFLIDEQVLQGDYLPMAYSVLPVMLAAMLLGVRAVLVIATLEGVGFALLIALAPSSTFNWPSLLSLIVVVTAISFTYAAVSEGDLHRLEVANSGLDELRAALHDESRHDPLTGLHNRRYLEEQSAGEIGRARRSGTGLGLVLLDVDHFKVVNDEHGHATGDEALVAVSSLLSTHSRQGDIACRMGGDEFLLVLVDSNLAGTALRAERLREQVEQAHEGVAGQSITVSVGVSSYPEHGGCFEALLDAADRALYAAKADGRNRVVVAPVAS